MSIVQIYSSYRRINVKPYTLDVSEILTTGLSGICGRLMPYAYVLTGAAHAFRLSGLLAALMNFDFARILFLGSQNIFCNFI
jgi:hypothetical protein